MLDYKVIRFLLIADPILPLLFYIGDLNPTADCQSDLAYTANSVKIQE
jgi:hypothetical protein